MVPAVFTSVPIFPRTLHNALRPFVPMPFPEKWQVGAGRLPWSFIGLCFVFVKPR